MTTRLRRLLLLPAAVLVILGTPALALDGSSAPQPDATAVPLPLPDGAGPGTQAEVDADADLVGVKWSGDPDAEFSIEVRRPGSDEWEPAATLGGDDLAPDEGSPDARSSIQATDGKNVTEPVWVDRSSEVRVTVVSGTVADASVEAVTAGEGKAPSSSAGALGGALPDAPSDVGYALALIAGGVGLGAVALGWSPWRSRRQVALVGVCALAVLAACAPPPPAPTTQNTLTSQPTITMRTSWGPDLAWNPSPDCAPGPEYATDVHFLVVHHTVNSNTYSQADSRNMVRAIWSYHVNTLGYCDIAYNFIIDRFGQIFEGRQGGIDRAVIAAHTGGFNRGSTGIALLGRYDPRPDEPNPQVPTAAWKALVDLSAWKLSTHMKNPADGFVAASAGAGARWPEGTVVSFPNRIVGHIDLWPTACPGQKLYERLGQLRTEVQPKIGWDGITPTTTIAA